MMTLSWYYYFQTHFIILKETSHRLLKKIDWLVFLTVQVGGITFIFFVPGSLNEIQEEF